ncbi:hypothetical protein IQ266_13160 [filamentous cyanobacterium LEGE 11480]|uniref:Ferrous iron transporter FeoA-like domain-containing protein n=1 Tax=Romeriopsis navalis LEGE 11480 TaxID=2777977 RepID=A0A928VLC7_9CYAN|nr:FeoA domain-containing protein [Romeriopsis navalis]MBE9030681.1 hypothetical protein [Romeriopsis navalis LEGE 11480]
MAFQSSVDFVTTVSPTIVPERVALTQATVGTIGTVVSLGAADMQLSHSGLMMGTIVEVMSLSARGSAIVQLASGEHVALNQALTKCIAISPQANNI